MSTDYTHLTNIAFDKLFARGKDGSETQIMTSSGALSIASIAATGTVTGSNLSGTNTGDQTNITGNAGTATALQTARNINGTSFNGTADITVTAAANTLTGTTLASGVTASSLTSVGTLTNLTVTNPISGSVTGNAATVTTNANLTGNVTSVGNATTIASNVVTNSMVNTSAAIAYSKLNLSSSIATGDLASALVVPSSKGGTGVANNVASTLTISGNFGTTLTVSGTTAVTLPTSGTLAPGTNWASYTPTIVGCGTVSSNTAFWRRSGDTLQVRGSFTTGTPTAVSVTISINGNTIDTTKLPGSKIPILGTFYRATSTPTSIPSTGNGVFAISFTTGDTSTVYFSQQANTANSVFTQSNGSTIFGSSENVSYQFEVPVTQFAF